jgi:hypothetical protein
VAHAFCHAPAGDHVRHGIFAGHGHVVGVIHHFAHARAELGDGLALNDLIGPDVAVHHTFLWVPQTVAFGDGDHVMEFIHVQVATRAVVGLQQGHHGLVPAVQYGVLARVRRVEVDAALGTTDRRSAHAELHFHGLGQALHFALVQTLAHAGATTGRAAAQAVDHHPAFRAGGGIVPFEYDLGGTLLKAAQGFTHHRFRLQVAAKVTRG